MRTFRVKHVLMLLIGIVSLVLLYRGAVALDRAFGSKLIAGEAARTGRDAPLIGLVDGQADTIRLTDIGMKVVGLSTVEVKAAPPPEPLRLPGSLLFDPNRLVRIHARFPGELVSLGTVGICCAPGISPKGDDGGPLPASFSAAAAPSGTALNARRQLRFGDRVEKGQIIAVVWSKDIGEKKSELVDAVSKTAIDKMLLARLEQVEKGVVPERTIQEARRNYEADLINVAKAERTLRSWRLTDAEIQEIHQEAERIHNRETSDPQGDRTWAETEIRSPINGVIVEKNFNVGDIIDASQDLFKIADLDRVQVLANAYEEDLPLLRSLRPEQRHWQIDIKSDPDDEPISGTFDIIGSIIDPAQHAGAVMGWLDNPDGRLKIGLFVTATIALPVDPSLVVVPTNALIEDGDSTRVFVAVDGPDHEFQCRKVAVVSRGREQAYLRAEPRPAEVERGALALAAGEYVVRSGVLELGAEMKALQAAANER